MKYLYFLLSATIATVLFTSCAGNKDLQDKAPANLGDSYYTTNGEVTTLYIPLNTFPTNQVNLESVYFRNKKANLFSNADSPGLLTAIFNNAKPDMVMSSDPKEEYGNKMPQKVEKMDFELNEDEAILIFTQNSKVKYYKIKGVKERV